MPRRLFAAGDEVGGVGVGGGGRGLLLLMYFLKVQPAIISSWVMSKTMIFLLS